MSMPFGSRRARHTVRVPESKILASKSTVYDRPVRRLLVLLMFCLLPLRGWAGDVMAIRMVSAPMAGTIPQDMPADCPMQIGVDHIGAGQQSTSDLGTEQTCCSCDLCLPFWEAPLQNADVVGFAGHVQRPSLGPASLNLAPSPGFKPPIF